MTGGGRLFGSRFRLLSRDADETEKRKRRNTNMSTCLASQLEYQLSEPRLTVGASRTYICWRQPALIETCGGSDLTSPHSCCVCNQREDPVGNEFPGELAARRCRGGTTLERCGGFWEDPNTL